MSVFVSASSSPSIHASGIWLNLEQFTAPVLGAKQIQWLKADLARQAKDAPIVVFTRRPLFSLLPQWDWATRDGQAAIDAMLGHANVTVFYGHIHSRFSATTSAGTLTTA